MKKRNSTRQVLNGVCGLLALFLALGWGTLCANGQKVLIRYRPLTPQEIKNFGLTNTTQKSSGAPNAGIGQPIYMEALVTSGVPVVSVNWTLLTSPPGSTASFEIPGALSITNPTYDGGDRIDLTVAGRAVLKPDVVSSYDFSHSKLLDYKIKTDVVFTNKTLSFTNMAYGAVYLGREHYLCVLCHADKQSNFAQTAHATAFIQQITGAGSTHFSSNCISCHTLGYDTTPGAVNDGFDDVAASVGWTFPGSLSPTNWTSMPTNLQQKANVQCENCHGAASAHMVSLGFTNAIDISLSAGTCGQCHDSLPQHVKAYEWGQSLHSTGFVFRFSGSCTPCHSAKGFIETWDPFYAPSNKVPRSTEQEGIACAACHDPHTKGMGEKQLRNIPTATLSNGVVVTFAQAGEGVLCMNCHHSRQEAISRVMGSSSIDPHHGTQGDMLLGENGFEYGMNMPSSRHLIAVSNSCVGCHMQLIAQTTFSNANTHVGGHTFKIEWAGPTNTVRVTEVCKTCHVGVYNNFDFGGEDYDRDGLVEGVQSEVEGLLEQLGNLLPPAGPTAAYDASFTLPQRKAIWNYIFVSEDKSLGVHNPKYAAALLQASIDDLNGGIDVDKDGLLDSWEMQKFGNLTSQTGDGDADSDGVSNLLEMQAGTNPNVADSDSDGYSDLAEMQGGSDPLSNLSTLATNTISLMLPALELGYLPETAGATQRFEYIDAMGNSGWTNAGPNFISSNSFSYQLISLRDSTQKYFRVVKP